MIKQNITLKRVNKALFAYCFYALIISIVSGCANQITTFKISRIFKSSTINHDHFTGFALYDQDKKKMVYQLNADKYFTPASNTKLFTFYTALQMLGDSIPGLRYFVQGDSLIFWGTGDPSFLHSTLKSTKAFDFFKNSSNKLFYSASNFNGNFYGEGWPYGDYNDYYQAEITAMPIEDNVALIYADTQGQLQIKPAYLKKYLQQDSSFQPQKFTVKRSIFENKFVYPSIKVPRGFKQEIHWKTSPQLTIELLQDTLKKQIQLINLKLPSNAKTLYSIAADSVYKQMLLQSDNFIAEQLSLVCSSTLNGNLSTQTTIDYSKQHFLKDLPDEPQWADGSGLSRYNLFTPRTIVALLQKICDKVGNEQKLHSLLPAGGVSGTLRNAYKTDNGVPFVWAKTGSLSNNHSQSGYLITRKGKRLIFSYQNNNFVRTTAEIRSEMVRIITQIHNRF